MSIATDAASATELTDREKYTNGLRALAAALEADETLPLPAAEITWPIWPVYDDDGNQDEAATAKTLAKIARLMDGPAIKDYSDEFFRMRGTIGGLQVRPWARREQVCTRVVKGTKEVTEKVATQFETVTTTVDDIEWECSPLLAAEVAS
jgi:hypothetical protein